ncbi:MAG: coproporphyrinogen dehydrogenase HemZ [Anaerocolumna sp.]
MIQIFLSKDEYEYEIHSLVKAFYIEEQIKVYKPSFIDGVSSKDQGNSLEIYIEFEDTIIKVKAVQNGTELYPNIKFDLTEQNNCQKEDVSISPVYYTRESGGANIKYDRNQLKRTLYSCLSYLTGKKLPWGTLTGVRPAKIAFEKLERNFSDADIRTYMSEQYLCSDEKINVSLQVAKREIALLQEMDYQKGYSIYIGIPFCPSTCLYCSFTSYSLERYGNSIELYLDALYKEITYAGTCGLNKKLTTIYLGGGTPTTLTAHQLNQLLSHIEATFDFTFVLEYTVEAGRPDSITADKLKVLKNHGVTRISINPQTMSQYTLDLIGRKHSVGQVIDTFHMARDFGHDNINMDMIIGLPGEKIADVAHTLAEINKLKPDSLTVHTLAIKRAARLNIQKEDYQDMVPTDTLDMLKLTWDYAKSANYLPYYLYRQKNMADNLENIGYAQYGKEGLYNILIMEEKQSILALGAGALSKFVFHEENRIERVENVKSLKDYIERIDEMIERKRIFLEENSQYL